MKFVDIKVEKTLRSGENMRVLIVYCHPCDDSFTYKVKENFIKGLAEAGHSYEISDLYKMNFNAVLSKEEYQREAFYETEKEIPADVRKEQAKIEHSDAIVFIYPVFWTEAPASLVGWFQRVWTYGYAYGDRAMKQLEKVLFLVTLGGSLSDAVRQEQVEAMKTVMIGDRIHDRAKESEMIIFDEMTRGYGNDENRAKRAERFCQQAYGIGQNF